MTYAEMIDKASSHEELKAIGAKLYKAKLRRETRERLIKLYRAKRTQLDMEMAKQSKNRFFKTLLFEINTEKEPQKIAAIGHTIYSCKAQFTPEERDLLFRSYAWAKKKNGIEFNTEARV
jgi:hypothetical protein